MPRVTLTRFPPAARVDGEPRRSHSSLNLRHEDKAVFDLLHAWWAMRSGEPLKQWDAFSVLLSLAMENPRADLPRDLLGPS